MDEEKVKLRAEVNSLMARVGLLENRSAFDALVERVALLENPPIVIVPKTKRPPSWMMKKGQKKMVGQKKTVVDSPVSDTPTVDSPIPPSAVSIEAQA